MTFFFLGGATARGGPWPPFQYASRPLDPLLCLHSFIPIFLRSVDTSSSHRIFGLPLRLVAAYIFFVIAVSCILSTWPSHRILCHLMNLTIFSSLIKTSNSSFRRILHNAFSFTGPYIFRNIFLSSSEQSTVFFSILLLRLPQRYKSS